MTPQELQERIDMLNDQIIHIPEGLDERIVRLVEERNSFHQSEIIFFQNKLDELNGSNNLPAN